MATAPAQKTNPPSVRPHLTPGSARSWELPEELRQFVASGSELAARSAERPSSPLPTAIAPLDRSLIGGLPRGCLTEVTGRSSSGRFSLALSTLAATTAAGDVAALVDLGNSLDPRNASELGIDLDRLLWLRPRHLKPALTATEIALQTGFPLVILDLGEPPVPGGRGREAAWLRLTRAAAAQRSVVYVSSPYRVSGTAATTVFETRRVETSWRGDRRAPYLLEKVRFHWQLSKTKHNATRRPVSFALSTPEAFLGETKSERRCLAEMPEVRRSRSVAPGLHEVGATQSA